MSLAGRLLATPILDRFPRLRRFVERHPRLAAALVAYLIGRWVVLPVVAVIAFAFAEGWLRW